MKKVIAILILVLFSCRSGNYSVGEANRKEVLVYYSKGPCLGKCPVYDFWVFTDGSFLYWEADRVKKNKMVKGRLTSAEMDGLAAFLKNHLGQPTVFRRIRDRPKTILRFDEREFEYYAALIQGPLKEANAKMEGLVRTLKADGHGR